TDTSRLWRSSKDEWLGGTQGFYWGCNNIKDLQVRLETGAAGGGKPAKVGVRPADRDQGRPRADEKAKGEVTADLGLGARPTAPLGKELKSWALFGPPRGATWEPTEDERTRLSDVRPLVSNDWTLLTGKAPAGEGSTLGVDVAGNIATWEPWKIDEATTLP